MKQPGLSAHPQTAIRTLQPQAINAVQRYELSQLIGRLVLSDEPEVVSTRYLDILFPIEASAISS